MLFLVSMQLIKSNRQSLLPEGCIGKAYNGIGKAYTVKLFSKQATLAYKKKLCAFNKLPF
jgi:hypothetical protein